LNIVLWCDILFLEQMNDFFQKKIFLENIVHYIVMSREAAMQKNLYLGGRST